MKMIFAIALGGAIGALGRHYLSNIISFLLGHSFPFSTIIVNLIGSFLMGILVSSFAHVWTPSIEIRAFLVIGVLGAFTTFSAFSHDVINIYERGETTSAIVYILLSIVLSVLAMFMGLRFMRLILG